MMFRDYTRCLYCTQQNNSRRVFLTQLNFYSVKKVDAETKIILKLCDNRVKSSAEISDLETYQGS